jgi:hypothetical protein
LVRPVKLWRNIIIGILVAVFGFAAYFIHGFVDTWHHIPEAYAAWDTGDLLIEHMKLHDNSWPSSWDDLVPAMNGGTDGPMQLWGAQAGDTNYVLSIRNKVVIDWSFDPRHLDGKSPVTRLDGTKFPFVWSGAEPNEMVRDYLKNNTNANALRPR